MAETVKEIGEREFDANADNPLGRRLAYNVLDCHDPNVSAFGFALVIC
jgi:hypothetical protein